MTRIRFIGLALVAAFALSAAAAASASAHTFNSTVTGKLKVVSNTSQVFATHGLTPVEVVCTTVEAVTGEAKAGAQAEITSKVHYSGCTLKIGTGTPLTAEVSDPTYNFHAENEAVDNTTEVKIKASGCTVTVPAQNGLKKVTYKNEGNDVNVAANVEKIKWSQSGLTCGTASGEGATYAGNALIEVVGGTISWE
jgi:hypothetical protein